MVGPIKVAHSCKSSGGTGERVFHHEMSALIHSSALLMEDYVYGLSVSQLTDWRSLHLLSELLNLSLKVQNPLILLLRDSFHCRLFLHTGIDRAVLGVECLFRRRGLGQVPCRGAPEALSWRLHH